MPKEASKRDTGHLGYFQTLPREPQSAEVARQLARTALAAWGQDELIEDAALVITELVSNAVNHAHCESIRVIVSRPSEMYVHLGVVDKSRTIPLMRLGSNDDQTHGRGLVLVDALTARWGTDLYSWGKQVWGEMKAGQ